jgi:hypothetical protein
MDQWLDLHRYRANDLIDEARLAKRRRAPGVPPLRTTFLPRRRPTDPPSRH